MLTNGTVFAETPAPGHIKTNTTLLQEEPSDKPGELVVPVERQQQIGVTYATVSKHPFSQSIRAVGSVASNKERHWEYVSRVDGYVQTLYAISRGQRIEKGAALLTLYSPDLLATQNEFLDVLKTVEEAKIKGSPEMAQNMARLLTAAKQRLRLWNISDQQVAELERTQKATETLTLYSPVEGVVQNLAVSQGGRVTNGDRLVAISDLSVVWVWAQFYQDELPLLKPGIPVTITASSYPGAKFDGKIALVDPFMDESLRTGRVRIDVENPDLKLRPKMYVDVELEANFGEGIAVPVSAILPTGRRNILFVDKGEGRLEPRFVGLGRKFGDYYQVKSGLSEGERVVSSGNFLIDAEAKVQGALKSW